MTGSRIEIETSEGVAEAYVSRPEDGEHPGVLFYIDAIGLRPRIEEMADRIASWGYVVLAPNVFYRDGTAADIAPTTDLRVAGNREAHFEFVMPLVAAHSPDQARRDADAYIDTLLDLPGTVGGEIGVTGYCMGGRLALRAAASRRDEVVAVGAFHMGGAVTEAEDSPHRVVGSARAEFFIGHADKDGSNPPEAIADLERSFDSAGLTYTSEVFEGAPHGYTMADTSMYDEAATERHFRELEALLGRHLKG